MIDLDERLDRARITVQSEINSVPVRPPDELVRHHRRARIYTVGSGLAALALFMLASSFVLGGGSELAAPTASIPAHTYTVELPGWDLVAVWESEDGSGRSHTLFDDENSSETALRRVKVDTGTAAISRRETLQTEGTLSVDRISLYGSDAKIYLTETDDELGWATVIATWTGPQDEQVAVLFVDISVEEAKALLTGLTPLDLSAWQSLTNRYEPPVTTTFAR